MNKQEGTERTRSTKVKSIWTNTGMHDPSNTGVHAYTHTPEIAEASLSADDGMTERVRTGD
jgi:hypothetical protein